MTWWDKYETGYKELGFGVFLHDLELSWDEYDEVAMELGFRPNGGPFQTSSSSIKERVNTIIPILMKRKHDKLYGKQFHSLLEEE